MKSPLTQDDLRAYYGAATTATYPINTLLQTYNALRQRTNNLHFTITTQTTLNLDATHTKTGVQTQYTIAPYTNPLTD